MTYEDTIKKLTDKFRGVILEHCATKPDPYLKVDPAEIHEVMAFIKNELAFETLSDLCGVDYPALAALCVVYHPFSYTHKIMLCLKCFLGREPAPHIRSVTDLYKIANWCERETYDLFGVVFDGHPSLRRILLPPDWVGHPLRKDYVTPDYYQGMPVPLYFSDGSAGQVPNKEVS